VLDDQVAIYTWLAIIAAGVAVMLLTGRRCGFSSGSWPELSPRSRSWP
jgi:hypothetical protein